MNTEDVVTSVQRKIDREKALINAANVMRQSTNNPAVLSRLDSQIRDGRRNIEYFEGTLRDLETRMENMSLQPGGGSGGSRGNPITPPPKDWNSYMPDGADAQGGYGNLAGGHGLMPPRAPYAPAGPAGVQPKRPNYSRLGAY